MTQIAAALDQWLEVRRAFYTLYNKLAGAIAKVGGIGAARNPDLTEVRAADQEAEALLMEIMKRTRPRFEDFMGQNGFFSSEFALAVGAWQSIDRVRRLYDAPHSDFTEAIDEIGKTLREIVILAIKYVTPQMPVTS